MTTTTRNPIRFIRGDSHVVRVTVSTRSAGVTAPMNLAGATAVLSVKSALGAAAYLAQKACTVVDEDDGIIEAAFAPADTSSLAAFKGVYDVQVTKGAAVYTVVVDTFELVEGVTD